MNKHQIHNIQTLGFDHLWSRFYLDPLRVKLQAALGRSIADFEMAQVLWLIDSGQVPENDDDALIRSVGGPTPPPASKPMTYGFHWGNFLYPFFGPATVGKGESALRGYFSRLQDRGDTDVLLNAEQDPWMVREGRAEWGRGFSAYSSDADLDYFVRMLDVAWLEYGLRPHVGIIDQPTLRRLYRDEGHRVLHKTRRLMNRIKGKATLVMPSWELGEVMSDGSGASHEMLEDRLVEWAEAIHAIDPEVWVGIHHAAGDLRGGNLFYGRMHNAIGHRACRYYQYRADDDQAAIEHQTLLIRNVAVKTGTSICVMEHSSPRRQNPTHTEDQARRRASWAARMLEQDQQQWNFMNGYPS